MRNLTLVTITVFLLSLSAIASESQKIDPCDRHNPPPKNVTVAKNVDGDTVHITNGKKIWSVRFLGIDTPETHYMGKSQGYWADKASDRMKELLPVGTKVQLEFTGEVCDQNRRVLAHIWKGKQYINLQMVKEGLAVNYCYYPNLAHCDDLGDLANDAEENRKGFFGDPNTEIPYIWRRQIRGEKPTSLVGDRETMLVYSFSDIDEIPVGNRVFFSKGKIPSPWKPAD